MGRDAEQVYIGASDVAVLEHWIGELAVNAAVRIVKQNGEVVEGVVSVTPTIQVFEGPDHCQGMNGIVKLIDRQRPEWDGMVWLGDIREVMRLDSVTTGSSRA